MLFLIQHRAASPSIPLDIRMSNPCTSLYRDVKPQNVLVGKEGTCKLADFGTAGKLDDNSCVGTLYYMSPEAMKGMWDQASDIWSFGVMLFQMFTGELPFASLQGTNVFSIMYHLRESNFQLKDISFIQDEARDMMGSCLQVMPSFSLMNDTGGGMIPPEGNFVSEISP